MAQGTFHFSTNLFLSSAHGTIFERNVEVDHPENHHEVRLQSCPVFDRHYTLSVRLLNMDRRRIRIRCHSTIWFRDEEVFSMEEEVVVDAGMWTQLGVINLRDELTAAEENCGVLILPGVEERIDDEGVRDDASSYMRVSINFVEMGGEDVVILPRRVATFTKWAVWTLFGYAMQHALGDQTMY